MSTKHTDPDCKCPTCRPSEWLVADLVREIRDRDDVLDELVMAGELVALYRDDRSFERFRQALLAWRNAMEV